MKKRFNIDSDLQRLTLLLNEVREFCSKVIDDETLIFDLELCLNEAVVNIIKHAYHEKPGNPIEIEIVADEGNIAFYLSDVGDAVPNIEAKRDLRYNPKDITTLPESGMGLFLIHKIMDEVMFRRVEQTNIFVMKKSLDTIRSK